LTNKLSRVTFLFWKLKSFVNLEHLKLAYFGLFQSHIQYGLLAWGHSPHTHELLLLQKKVIRIMAGAGPVEPCKPLFISFRICTVINLYIYNILIYTKANLQHFLTRQDIHNHNTRKREKLDLHQHRLALTGNSFESNCVKFYNKLPDPLFHANVSSFKTSIYNWLLDNPFYSLKEFLDSTISI